MGTLLSSLSIARSGMRAAQVQMDVTGHNIANVNNEAFSRQRVTLSTLSPDYRSYGALGRGVQIDGINRIRETFLDTVYRQQAPELGSATVRATYFTRIEDVFQEPSEDGLSSQLNEFFDQLSEYSGNVDNSTSSQAVVTQAESLTVTLHSVDERLTLLRTNANEEAKNTIPEINSLTERIAGLNIHIRDVELGGMSANDLRDERDHLLDQLSSLINITTRERTDGQVDVLVSGDVLVDGDNTRELMAVPNSALDPNRNDLVEIQFADNGQDVNVRSGELFGVLSIRDIELVDLAQRIDTIAHTIIEQINGIHSQANGAVNWSGLINSTNAVEDATAPLVTAGLPFAVTPGTFDVAVYDDADNVSVTSVTITATTTLEELVAALDGIPNFSAALDADGTGLELGADATYTSVFSNDGTGILPALGINGLFTGTDADSIAVNPHLIDDPNLLASGYSLDSLVSGDNLAALAMADVRNALILEDNSATLNDYYESMIVKVGVDARTNQDSLNVEEAFVQDFDRRRQEVSGVSLDEEVANLLLYERAYQASTRVVTTVDRMLDALLSMAR